MNNNVLASNLDRGAFVDSCVSALADVAWAERDAMTNVSINKVICYTKPVPLTDFGVISLAIIIDGLGRTTIPEVWIFDNENELNNHVAKLRNYTTHVVMATGANVEDGVGVEYSVKTGVLLTNYISVGLSCMTVFSQIVSECINALNIYFANVGYNPDTIMYGVDRPNNDIVHEENVFQFISSELVITVNMFRVDVSGQINYDFTVGLLLAAMRSGKNDSKFHGVRL